MKQIEQKIFETKDAKDVRVKRTVDGFKNLAMKLGVSAPGAEGCEDNAISNGHYDFNLVTRNRTQLEAAYRGSWIVGRVVDCVAEDMTKEGIVINTNDGADKVIDFMAAMSRLQILSSLRESIQWGRLYGGAIGVLQIDGQDLNEPLDPDTVGKDQFLGIAVYDRWQLNPSLGDVITRGPNIGLPMYYDITLGSNQNDPGQAPDVQKTENKNRVRVHHSRCFRMGGHKLPYFQAITEMMWDESIIERLWDRLIEFDTTNASAAGLVGRALLRTVGIAGLRDILSAGGEAEEALIAHFDYIRKFQSSEGLTLLDKEDNFQTTAYSFSGLSDVLLQFAQQVSGASEIPLVRLMGQSPAGLNATGDGDIRNYYDSIKSKQESKLRGPMELIIKIMWRSVFDEDRPKDLTFDFVPLWQIDAVQKSTVATNTTNSIIAAHEAGLVDTPTAMQELKAISPEIGIFSHITDEKISEAESEPPPAPELPEAEIKKPTGDSAWKKIKKLIKKK